MLHPVDIYVGSRLRRQRHFLGLSQGQLGGKLGLSFQQIQKYEKGTNGIRASKLYELAHILNVPIFYFFRGYEYGGELRKEFSNPITDNCVNGLLIEA